MTTDWTFGGSWPYRPNYFVHADGRLHYIDEGPSNGRPVVLVHGNPTWGYLYRRFVGPLTDAGYRVIVPDHLGFGRSDKPDRPELYRIGNHIDRFDALMESLDLRNATIVCQDWGGYISLGWAVRHPQRVRSLFPMNTFAHRPRSEVSLPVPIRMFQAPGLGELLVKGLHFFVRGFLFRAGVVKKDRLTAPVKQAYLAPHPNWRSRTPVLVFPREIPSGPTGRVSDLGAEIERGLEDHFRSKPVKIMWAMQDPAFRPEFLDTWRETFPDAEVVTLDDASHYLQEDAHEVIVPQLIEFLDR